MFFKNLVLKSRDRNFLPVVMSYIGYYDVVLGDVDGRDMSPGYFVGSREISSALNRSTFLITRPRSTSAITHLPSQLVSQENRFATLFSSSIRAPLARIHMTIFSNHNTGFYKPQTSKISIMIYAWSMREMNYWYPARLKLVWMDSFHLNGSYFKKCKLLIYRITARCI